MATKTVTVRCPICGNEKVMKNGHNRTGKQVYRCNNPACHRKSMVFAELVDVEAAEMDEMWSFVHDKPQQYRL